MTGIKAAPNQQAWGVASLENGRLHWCHGHGPRGYKRHTKRLAIMVAFQSNNAEHPVHFVPVPLPGSTAYEDLEPYVEGPYSDECIVLYKLAHERLMANPDLDYDDLEHIGQPHIIGDAWEFPWRQPQSHYDTDGPAEITIVRLGTTLYRVDPTGDSGLNSGRGRFHVSCQSCHEVLHTNTTGPSVRIRQHHRENHQVPMPR